jgi:uroporphyrinogen decarboxylase
METGIDGIFYAIQHAQAGLMTLDEYKSFGIPFDLITTQPATGLWCNLLHIHGLNIYFDLITQSLFHEALFPIVNWHDRETPPSLEEAQKRFPGVVCGGVSQKTIVFGDSSQAQEEAAEAIRRTGGRRLLLGTGCVIPIIAPHGNIQAIRDLVTTSGSIL